MSTNKNGFCISLLFAGLFGVAAAWGGADGQPPATTAQEAAHRAILNNPEVQSKWHTFLAAIQEEQVYSSGFWPRVDLEGRVGREYDHQPGPTHEFGYGTATLQLTQMLYDGYFTRNLVSQFEHAKLVRYYELLDSAETMALEAVRAFEEVQRQRELVDMAQANYRKHKEIFDKIESRAKAGLSRAVDLDQIGGRLALSESNLITEVSNLNDVTARYVRVVGERPAEKLKPLQRLDKGVPATARETLLAAYKANPSFHAALENITAARFQLERERSAHYPQLDLRVRNTWNHDVDDIPGDRQAAVIELALKYNLYNGGRTNAKLREQAELVNEARDRRDIVCRNIRQELTIAWSDTRRLAEQLVQQETHRNSTDKVRTAYQQQFDIGERGLLDLLDSENEYFEASRKVSEASHNWSIAFARTQAGLGNLLRSLGIARDGVPTLADLGADPLQIDPEWICPADVPEFLDMAALTQVPKPPVKVEVVTLDAVALFDFDHSELRPDAHGIMMALVQKIRNTEGVVRIEVVGHTDAIGTEEYNQGLSERRAASVREFLVEQGIDAGLIQSRGMGEGSPVADNETEEGRQRNRRVEVAIEVRERR